MSFNFIERSTWIAHEDRVRCLIPSLLRSIDSCVAVHGTERSLATGSTAQRLAAPCVSACVDLSPMARCSRRCTDCTNIQRSAMRFPERSNTDVNSIFASLVRAGGEARAVPRAVRMGRRRREHRSPIVTRRAAAVSAAADSAIERAERARWERGEIPAMAVAIGSASRHREPRGVRLGPRRASPPEEATTP